MALKSKRLRLFETTNTFKRVFMILTLMASLAMSLLILLRIKEFPSSDLQRYEITGKVISLSLVWYGSSILNKNLVQANSTNWPSYILAFLVNAYLGFFVFYKWNYAPSNIKNFDDTFYFFSGLMVIDVCWGIIIYFGEKKNRPYFSRQIFWSVWAKAMFIILIIAGRFMYRWYVVEGQKFDYLRSKDLAIILIAPIIASILLGCLITSWMISSKYNVQENEDARTVVLWNSFIRIISITIWNLYSFKMYYLNSDDYIFIGVFAGAVFITLVTLIAGLKKYQTNFLLYIITLNITLMAVCSIIFINKTNAHPSYLFIMFMSYMILYQSIFILKRPPSPILYPSLNALLSYVLIIFTMFIWLSNKLIGEINVLNIQDWAWGIVIAVSLMMLIICVSSEYGKTWKINKRINKLLKWNKKIKGVK